MTKEEMKKRIADIERKCDENKRFVYDLYAQTAAKFKHGDIISDGFITISIENVSFSLMADDIVYRGAVLTVKGTPRADGAESSVYEGRAHKITFHEKKS